jgi:hypothetical protein
MRPVSPFRSPSLSTASVSSAQSLPRLFAHALPESFTPSLHHSITPSLHHSITPSPLTRSPIHPFKISLTLSITSTFPRPSRPRPFPIALTHSLTHTLTRSLTHTLPHPTKSPTHPSPTRRPRKPLWTRAREPRPSGHLPKPLHGQLPLPRLLHRPPSLRGLSLGICPSRPEGGVRRSLPMEPCVTPARLSRPFQAGKCRPFGRSDSIPHPCECPMLALSAPR